jgi:hypothetical protein
MLRISVAAIALLVAVGTADAAAAKSCASFDAPNAQRPHYRAEHVQVDHVSCVRARHLVKRYLRDYPAEPRRWNCHAHPYSCHRGTKSITWIITRNG